MYPCEIRIVENNFLCRHSDSTKNSIWYIFIFIYIPTWMRIVWITWYIIYSFIHSKFGIFFFLFARFMSQSVEEKKKVFRLVWELFICYGTHIHHISNTLFSFDFARAVETNENLSMYPKLSSCNNFVRPIEEVQFGGRVALLHQQTSINHIIFWFS